jgi:S-layer protein (TIGR01567 family)
MMKKLLAILLIAIMSVSMVGAERITEDVEIRGEIMTGAGLAQYDFQNAAMFWYKLDTGMTSETLNVTVTGTQTVAENAIVYKCVPQTVNYKNTVLGTYTIVGFMAEKYIAYDGKTNKLVKLLIEWGKSKDKVLAVGESLEMPEGYTLIAREIDLDGGKCLLSLYKDGIGLDTEIVQDGATYQYFDDDDVLVCSVKVESVFRGTESNVITVTHLFLRSEDIMDVDTGDNFGIMEVVSTSGGITLKNDDSVTLGADDKVDIMGSMYFKVADDTNTLRYYLAKTVSLECEECPEIPVCPDCPTPEPCEPCPEVTPETVEVIKYINVTAEPVEDNTLPGFGVVLPLAGLLIVAYFIIKQKD